MKTVNDFLSHDCFYIKHGSDVLGFQINIWGETELSDKYGSYPVINYTIETIEEVYGTPFVICPEETALVLYI